VSCVTYEFWASRLSSQGNTQAAGVFKRAAALSLLSLQRWIRPTGDMWIIKNRFDPELRFGYEDYSFDTNYNLLPASMLATAYLYVDDSIQEGNSFAEIGGFVFSPDQFHKVFANAGGLYVEIELYPDSPTHDALGLTRVHVAGVEPLVAGTANAPQDPVGNPNNFATIAAGVQWAVGDVTQRMSNFAYNQVSSSSLTVLQATTELCEFLVTYDFTSASLVPTVVEHYKYVTP
jgi:hypothetical protein